MPVDTVLLKTYVTKLYAKLRTQYVRTQSQTLSRFQFTVIHAKISSCIMTTRFIENFSAVQGDCQMYGFKF